MQFFVVPVQKNEWAGTGPMVVGWKFLVYFSHIAKFQSFTLV